MVPSIYIVNHAEVNIKSAVFVHISYMKASNKASLHSEQSLEENSSICACLLKMDRGILTFNCTYQSQQLLNLEIE